MSKSTLFKLSESVPVSSPVLMRVISRDGKIPGACMAFQNGSPLLSAWRICPMALRIEELFASPSRVSNVYETPISESIRSAKFSIKKLFSAEEIPKKEKCRCCLIFCFSFGGSIGSIFYIFRFSCTILFNKFGNRSNPSKLLKRSVSAPYQHQPIFKKREVSL